MSQAGFSGKCQIYMFEFELFLFSHQKNLGRERGVWENRKDVLVINLYIIQLKRVLQKSYWNEHNKEKIKTYLIKLIIN